MLLIGIHAEMFISRVSHGLDTISARRTPKMMRLHITTVASWRKDLVQCQETCSSLRAHLILIFVVLFILVHLFVAVELVGIQIISQIGRINLPNV